MAVMAADGTSSAAGWVPCDGAGDIYFYTDATSGDVFTCWLEVWGYELRRS